MSDEVSYTAIYDSLIQAASKQYLPQLDWRWIKAELVAESDLNPTAVSSAGADGIAQFLPDTFKSVAKKLNFPVNASAFDPQYAIPACAYYLNSLWQEWVAPRSTDDHRKLMQASYNAGFGNLLKAQGLANNATDYASIIAMLPNVTGIANAFETAQYVTRIGRYYAELIA